MTETSTMTGCDNHHNCQDPHHQKMDDGLAATRRAQEKTKTARKAAVSPQKLYACPHPGCGKFYTRIYTLNKHLPIHGARKHVCDICGKKFSLKQYLKEHKLTHTGERPYKCNYPGCDRSFRQRGKLSIHKKEHLNATEMEERRERITRRNASLQLKEFNKNIILQRGDVDVENYLHSQFDNFVTRGILPIPRVMTANFHSSLLVADNTTGSVYLSKQMLLMNPALLPF